MSLFNNILENLGLKKPEEPPRTFSPAEASPTAKAGAAPTPKPAAVSAAGAAAAASAAKAASSAAALAAQASAARARQAIPVVDVMAKLEGLAKKNPMKLNWKESIVDLLALLNLPHSSNDLKELAIEMKCPEPTLGDNFKRNMWLHKAVLKAIADNGGNIPANLLD
jgi:hypothetical protein